MADLQRLAQALKNADAAGDSQAASRIAQAIRQMQAQTVEPEARINDAFNAANSDVNIPVSNARVGGAAADGISQGITFGFGDEIAAGLASVTGVDGEFGEYDKNLARQRIRQEQNKQAAPVTEFAGQIGGAVLTGTALAKGGLLASAKLAPNAGVGARTTAAAIDGTIAGAASGAGNAESQRLKAAGQGATIGLFTGGAIGNVAGRIERSKVLKGAISATDEIKAAASSLYKEAEQAGVAFNQSFYNRLVSSARQTVGRTHSGLHPKTQAALEVLENEKGRVLSLSEVDEIRQVINNAKSGADAADARLLGKITDRLDSFVNSAKPRDITGNREGIQVLGEARKLWQKQAKSQVIDDIIEKAQNQATGFENGMRVQFRSLANNPKRFKQFNAKEQAAIKTIIRGGPLENTLRAIGWLDPRGPFGALLTGGVGVGTGVAPAAALAGAGLAGKKLAEGATRNNVSSLQRVVSNPNAALSLPAPSSNPSIASQVVAPNIQANSPSQRR